MSTTESGAALAGVRVLDVTSGPAGGQASTVLADFGADVVKVEPATGDRFRALPASPFWMRGKRSIVLDLGTIEGRTEAQRLACAADVLLVAGPPSRIAAWGLDISLRDRSPRLVHCALTGWGMNGPYAELAGYEGLIAAKFGRMAAFDVQLGQDRPVYAAVQVATHVASQAAVQGILAALYQRSRTGLGAAVETSLLQGLQLFDLVDLLARQLAERRGTKFTPLRKAMPMPTLNYHPLRTADGQWIQCGNLLEHLFYSFLDAVELLGEFLIEEQFQDSPASWTAEAIEQARDRILLRMQERTASEWMEIFANNGNVAAEPIITTAQALEHADLVNGHGLVQVEDPSVGTTTQIAPIAELSVSPGSVSHGAPLIGEHTEQVIAEWADRSAEPVGVELPRTGQPLADLTILDLSTIIAAPLGISMLADLGARVIKVEPYGGDPFRGLLTEGRMAVKTNAGKESICIDLKRPEGQAILHQLAADADVLVHNFRGDVPDKLGIAYEQLRSVNPDIIVAIVNGYGPHGPGAKRPATHPVMGACTGGVALQAGQALTRECPTLADVRENARQIMVANEANPDPNTSVVAASAILLALHDRVLHERGQLVRINMQVANAWANGDDFLAYGGKPPRPTVDEEHLGLSARYRLYPTDDGWVFLAVPTDAEVRRFADVAGLATASDPAELDDEQLAEAIEALLITRSADEWESLLSSSGVGCVRADGLSVNRFITDDPHMQANEWSPQVEHLRFGSVHRWGPAVTVDGPNPDYGSAPLAGEQTDAILTSLGFDAAAIADLRTAKVVNSENV